jgi:hypothetical protein
LPNRKKNRFSTPRKFEEDAMLDDAGETNFPLMTSVNLGISKYDTNSNGSPVRKCKRKDSTESFEKLQRAPMKANCVNQNEAGLFLAEK